MHGVDLGIDLRKQAGGRKEHKARSSKSHSCDFWKHRKAEGLAG